MFESNSPLIFLAAVLITSLFLFLVIVLTRKAPKKFDLDKYRDDWQTIQQSVTDEPATWQLAVMNADKLLDRALKESNFKGKTMGERMVSAGRVLKKRDHVWAAHKLRNRLAHEDNVRLSKDLTKQALASFRGALKDLGALS